MGFPAPFGAVPGCDRLGGPLLSLTGVAGRAGVRAAGRHRDVRPRDSEAVVAAGVHLHVGALRHVAVRAPGAVASFGMEVVFWGVVVLRREGRESVQRRVGMVALLADGISEHAQPKAVRVVAVGATHPLGEHPALREGPVFVDLAENLTVGMVEPGIEKRGAEGVQEGVDGGAIRADRGPEGMAGGARLDLPGGVAEMHLQGRLFAAGGEGRGAPVRPLDVALPGAVTALAADVDRAPGGFVGVAGGVVVQLQVCRMAVGAAGVPVLAPPRPVERIAGGNRFVGVKVEPFVLDGVPGDAERLQPAAG